MLETRLTKLFISLGLGFTMILGVLFAMAWYYEQESVVEMAMATARTSAGKDLLYRDFLVRQGAVYMAMDKIGPEENLVRPDRDIAKPDGTMLTMVTPKRFLNLITAADAESFSFKAAIKTFIPLGTEDIPDSWEERSLQALRAGALEVGELKVVAGESVLRYMRPAYATPTCVRNRPGTGLQEGDLLGGMSLQVPMAPYQEIFGRHIRLIALIMSLFWLTGLVSLLIVLRCLSGQNQSLRAALIEQRNQAEQARVAQEELEKTFDAITDIITVQDAQMQIIKVNSAACELLGATSEELIGKKCYEVFRGTLFPCEGCPELLIHAGEENHRAIIEHQNLGKIFDVSAVPILDRAGQVTAIVHCAKDISETRRLERQLSQAQKMEAIGILAGGIAHDFNNILTVVMGYGDLAKLALEREGKGSVLADVEEILRATQRAKDLVRQILTFSRTREQAHEPLYIQAIVKEVLKFIQTVKPASVSLHQEIDETCGLIVGDPSQIHQVVMNLCTNGCQAMQERGGRLEVLLQPLEVSHEGQMVELDLPVGQYVCLSVRDSGSGIEESILARIFEPYFTTKAKTEGTGLGLSVVHGIVQSMGGAISAMNVPTGGALFKVYFPVHLGAQFIPETETLAGQIPRGSESVLVVDDQANLGAVLGRILRELGYQVDSCVSSSQALQAFSKQPEKYDLLITDMDMPELSGMDLVRSVRLLRQDIPVIIYTGMSGGLSEDEAAELRAQVLFKPLRLSELACTIRQALVPRKS